jgi:uncharacterized protein
MSKNILLLGEFSTGKSAFLNMLLGVQLLPEQLDSTNLPIVKIQAGNPGGIGMREPGQKYPRNIGSWSDIPDDWNGFEHAEVTVAGHPYLDKGLVFWDTPGINTTNSHHKKHLDEFLNSTSSDFLWVFYFVSGNLTSTSMEFLRQNRSLWDKMTIIVNIKEVMQESQSRLIESELKKTVWTQLSNLPVELLYIGDACEEFNALSDKNRGGLSDYDLMRKWSELNIDLNELLERHADNVIGVDLFDLILTFADMPEPQIEMEEEKVQLSESKLQLVENPSYTARGDFDTREVSVEVDEFNLTIKSAKLLLEKEKPKEAERLFRKAAEQGHPDAQFELGILCQYDRAIKGKSKEAIKWYEKAAEHGHAKAQYQLGRCYYLGWGVKGKKETAVNWYQKAADQGHPGAQTDLATCYQFGNGTKQNELEAVKWFKKAANQGHADAQYQLGNLYSWGELLDYLDDEDELEYEHKKEAAKWLRKAADQGHDDAIGSLGDVLSDIGGSENEAESVKWYKKAADLGNSDSQYSLGKCYRYGKGVTIDLSQAIKWFRKAANNGHTNAKIGLRALTGNTT